MRTILIIIIMLASVLSGCGQGTVGSHAIEIQHSEERCGYDTFIAGKKTYALRAIPGAAIPNRYQQGPALTKPGIATLDGDFYLLGDGWYGNEECAFYVL